MCQSCTPHLHANNKKSGARSQPKRAPPRGPAAVAVGPLPPSPLAMQRWGGGGGGGPHRQRSAVSSPLCACAAAWQSGEFASRLPSPPPGAPSAASCPWQALAWAMLTRLPPPTPAVFQGGRPGDCTSYYVEVVTLPVNHNGHLHAPPPFPSPNSPNGLRFQETNHAPPPHLPSPPHHPPPRPHLNLFLPAPWPPRQS